MIAVGWFEVDAGGHGVDWFGVELPRVFPTMETLAGCEVEDTAETVHKWLAYTMLGVAAVHVAAVAKHRWIDGHDVLRRMTFGGPGPSRGQPTKARRERRRSNREARCFSSNEVEAKHVWMPPLHVVKVNAGLGPAGGRKGLRRHPGRAERPHGGGAPPAAIDR